MEIIENQKRNYEMLKASNTDIYGAGVIRYAQIWAMLMESELKEGKKVAEIAKETSLKADGVLGGITGYMHNYAVLILCRFWIYGEELRKWHNLSVCPDQGKIANESGSILNSSVLKIVL